MPSNPESPTPRPLILRRLLEDDVDLEQAFDRLAAKDRGEADSQAVRAVIPGDALESSDLSLAVLLASVLAEYEDIEAALAGLQEDDSTHVVEDRVVVVSEEELADPQKLTSMLEAMGTETERFEFLFSSAKGALERLDVFELSSRPAEELVRVLRSEGQLGRVQALVEFLRHLQEAADSFEALALPKPHIREYLRQLYQMGNWEEMSKLVRVLSGAVSSLYAGDGAVGKVTIDLAADAIDPAAGAVHGEKDAEGGEEDETPPAS